MPKFRLSRLAIGITVVITALSLVACAALKIITDVMELRGQDLASAAAHANDPRHLFDLNGRLESWSIFGDYVAWAVAALVLVGSFLVILGLYRYILRPLSALASAMTRFTEGDRTARAGTSPSIELTTVASKFNQMADILTGQHERMLKFLGGTTHELKEPVHAMRTALQEFAPGKHLDERLVRQRLTVVSSALDRLDRMVDTYLDSSHVEWRRLDLQQGRQDFVKIVQQVSRLYEGFSPTHHLAVSLPEGPVWGFFDPDRISQVIHTLLTNAIAFSPRGGVVELCLSCDREAAILRVTDHGIGISEKDVEALFEPFQRVSSAFQNSPGVPVAFSVARRIVQAHQGRIAVSSKVGEGSTFRVHLPLAGTVAAEEAAAGREARHERRANGHDGRAPSPPQASAPR